MTRMLTPGSTTCSWAVHTTPAPAVVERYDPTRAAWIPTCREHTNQRAPRPEARYGRCPCSELALIRKNGAWGKHLAPSTGLPCPESGMRAIQRGLDDTTVQDGGPAAGADPTWFRISQTANGAGAGTPAAVRVIEHRYRAVRRGWNPPPDLAATPTTGGV